MTLPWCLHHQIAFTRALGYQYEDDGCSAQCQSVEHLRIYWLTIRTKTTRRRKFKYFQTARNGGKQIPLQMLRFFYLIGILPHDFNKLLQIDPAVIVDVRLVEESLHLDVSNSATYTCRNVEM